MFIFLILSYNTHFFVNYLLPSHLKTTYLYSSSALDDIGDMYCYFFQEII